MSPKKVIIIGAGYGGMALANLLGKVGYRVDVYEQNPSEGGRISTTHQGGFTFDYGPSWYLMPEAFDQYYGLFGESAANRLELKRLTPAYKVFFEAHDPVTIQGDAARDAAAFEAIEPGAGEKLQRYVTRSSRVYELSLNDFLHNNYARLREFLLSAALSNAGTFIGLVSKTLDSYVAKSFRDTRLRQLLEYHMVFLGSSPFQAPAIYTLMSHMDYKGGVFYPRKGMQYLATDMKALGASYDINYHFGLGVTRIIIKEGSAVGVQLDDGTEALADTVVSNADLWHTETGLLPREYQSFPESYWVKRQSGPGALLVSLGVKGSLPGLLHHNLYFAKEWRKNFEAIYETKTIPDDASIYICNPTKSDPSLAPPGHENMFILMPIPAGVRLDKAEQEAIAARLIGVLSRVLHVPDLVDRIVEQVIFGPDNFAKRYNAWNYNAFGGESHVLSQSVWFRTPNKSRKVKKLYYVGAGARPGIGLPMCLISAQLTFKLITGSRKRGPLAAKDIA